MTLRLTMLALEHWRDVEGYAVSHGMGDLRRLTLSQFCSYVWWFFTHNAEDEQELAKFEQQIWMPPKGEVGQGVWSAEAETAAFGALKTALGQ